MSVSVATDIGVLTKFKAAHASISQVDLTGPPQIDRTVEVLYNQGSFNVRIDGIAGPLGQERELKQEENAGLAAQPQGRARATSAGGRPARA